MPAGSLLGALAVTQLADRLGRKKTIILAGLIWVIGSTLQSASIVRPLFPSGSPPVVIKNHPSISQNREMLVVGRIISGISVGLASAVIPIYQSEITAPAIRGRIISLQQWCTHQSYLKSKYNKLTGFLGLFHGVFSSNTSFNSVAHTSTGPLHSEFLGASK